LHKCLLSEALAYNTFVSVTNHHQFNLNRVCFLGTSGHNIDDLGKYSDAKEKLYYMERTINWRRLTPTAPDTLGCYLFTDRDPFVIKDCPHVYFCGNQKKYTSRLHEGSEGQVVRLFYVPSFCEIGSVHTSLLYLFTAEHKAEVA
jgi:DNA polymerase delta subunit 2